MRLGRAQAETTTATRPAGKIAALEAAHADVVERLSAAREAYQARKEEARELDTQIALLARRGDVDGIAALTARRQAVDLVIPGLRARADMLAREAADALKAVGEARVLQAGLEKAIHENEATLRSGIHDEKIRQVAAELAARQRVKADVERMVEQQRRELAELTGEA